jgi:hypothetical protein
MSTRVRKGRRLGEVPGRGGFDPLIRLSKAQFGRVLKEAVDVGQTTTFS